MKVLGTKRIPRPMGRRSPFGTRWKGSMASGDAPVEITGGIHRHRWKSLPANAPTVMPRADCPAPADRVPARRRWRGKVASESLGRTRPEIRRGPSSGRTSLDGSIPNDSLFPRAGGLGGPDYLSRPATASRRRFGLSKNSGSRNPNPRKTSLSPRRKKTPRHSTPTGTENDPSDATRCFYRSSSIRQSAPDGRGASETTNSRNTAMKVSRTTGGRARNSVSAPSMLSIRNGTMGSAGLLPAPTDEVLDRAGLSLPNPTGQLSQ